jgi:ribonuclease Y
VPQLPEFLAPLVSGLLLGLFFMLLGIRNTLRGLRDAREEGSEIVADARRDAENLRKEAAVEAQERILAFEQEVERRERELEERERQLEARTRQLERESSDQARQRKQVERRSEELAAAERRIAAAESAARQAAEQARSHLERIAGLSAAEARASLIAEIEAEARSEASRLTRRIEDEARQSAERQARSLIVQASQRVSLPEVMESTVSFIELPNDEMKGRIIGKEGRNIRALEMATGIDLIVDDTPRSIWISSFDPLRREIARVALDRLLQDGRIHPARIEEAVQQVGQEMDGLIEEKGREAAFSLGISDMHARLLRLVGELRYHTSHGQNLLQHALETAQIAGHMALELGGRPEVGLRAGLLHEIGQVDEDASTHAILRAAELCVKYGESEEVADAIRALHPEMQATSLEALLLNTANRLSENRPGARKENLSVFIERLRRLEAIACRFPGVKQAYAIKAGRELRVIVDTHETQDETAYQLAKQIARAVERELSYPGQIKISVVRETRSVRFAV